MSRETKRLTGKSAKMKELEETLAGMGVPLHPDLYLSQDKLEEWIKQLKDGASDQGPETPAIEETEEEIDARLRERFEDFQQLTSLAISGDVRALIVYGPPGLGKTYSLEKALNDYDPTGTKYSHVKGYSTAVGILKQLWDNRHEGSILILDDCDRVWEDETALSLIKAATDTSKTRVISYLSEGQQISDKDQSRVAKSFVFDGTLIFVTNKDLDRISASSNRMAEHIQAVISRGHYVDLTMRTRRDAMVRIQQVAMTNAFMPDMRKEQKLEVINYVRTHMDTLRNLDLRMALKIADLRRKLPQTWQRVVKNTCFRA